MLKGTLLKFELINTSGKLFFLNIYPLQIMAVKKFNSIPKDEDGKYYFEFTWNEKDFKYQFLEFPIKGMGNAEAAAN